MPPNMQIHLVTSEVPKNATGEIDDLASEQAKQIPVLTVINVSTKTNPDGSKEAVID